MLLLAWPAARRVGYRNAGVLMERLLSLVPVRGRLGCGHRRTGTGIGRACGPDLIPGRRTFRFESAISLAASRDNTRLIAFAQLKRSVSNEAASQFAGGRARSAGDARGSPTHHALSAVDADDASPRAQRRKHTVERKIAGPESARSGRHRRTSSRLTLPRRYGAARPCLPVARA